MDRSSRLSPLGLQRIRVLDCLGGNNLRAPGYFDPPEDIDIFASFAAYIARWSQQCAADPNPLTISLLAAGRLLCGDQAAADVIVDQLRSEPFKLDHGAGICVVTPKNALGIALPLPADLQDTGRWLAGSAEQAALRAWLVGHRDRLHWVEAAGVYLPRAAEPPAQFAPPAGAVARVRHVMTKDGHAWLANSDLTLVDGVLTAVIKWNVVPEGQRHPAVRLDPAFLHHIDWEDADYVYDRPIEDPRHLEYRPSLWRRLFG